MQILNSLQARLPHTNYMSQFINAVAAKIY